MFALVADGDWGIRKLLAFIKKLPGSNLERDSKFYNNEENKAVMKIINFSLEVVQDEQLRCGLEVVCSGQQQPSTVTEKTASAAAHVEDTIEVERLKRSLLTS